ncbi:MAG TPA: HAMP domain-containing sensor histidine kinase [Acidimicrobiales bacterium]|nr:HAMP domain-containing sensor histidine kinase [Acidimicrobiales bacterium]
MGAVLVLLISSDGEVARHVGDALAGIGAPWPTVELRREPHVGAAVDALEDIDDATPLCALVDVVHGDAEPVAVLHRGAPTLPLVALVGSADAGAGARAAGAHDHVELASLAPELLARVLEHAVGCATAQADRRAADEQLVQFARKVAHGLRNPLAIASGMLDLLDRQVGEQLEDEMRDLLERSSDALRRAGDLVLALQRYVSAIRAEDRKVAVELGPVVRRAADSSGLTGSGATVDIGPLPTVLGDRDALARVFHELLDNVLRHAGDDGPPHVVVAAEEADDRWRLTVTDDGAGIPADQREEAFAEGERLGRLGDGFGLGLAAVRAIVARNGGAAHLEDGPGGVGLRAVVEWPKAALSEERLAD